MGGWARAGDRTRLSHARRSFTCTWRSSGNIPRAEKTLVQIWKSRVHRWLSSVFTPHQWRRRQRPRPIRRGWRWEDSEDNEADNDDDESEDANAENESDEDQKDHDDDESYEDEHRSDEDHEENTRKDGHGDEPSRRGPGGKPKRQLSKDLTLGCRQRADWKNSAPYDEHVPFTHRHVYTWANSTSNDAIKICLTLRGLVESWMGERFAVASQEKELGKYNDILLWTIHVDRDKWILASIITSTVKMPRWVEGLHQGSHLLCFKIGPNHGFANQGGLGQSVGKVITQTNEHQTRKDHEVEK